MKNLVIEQNESILIVAPHPDDESIGCGGLLIKYPYNCSVWVLTDGRFGCVKGRESETADRRANEFKTEMNSLGIDDYRMFGIYDTTLPDNTQLLIHEDFTCFDRVFVTNKYDEHPDHAAAYQIVRNAINYQGYKGRLFQYEVGTPLTKGTCILDITDVIDKKCELIAMNQSQMEMLDYTKISRCLNSFRAEYLGKKGYFVERYYEEIN